MKYKFWYMKAVGQGTTEHRKIEEAKINSFQIDMKIKFKWYITKPLEGVQSYTQKEVYSLRFNFMKQKYDIQLYGNKW